MKIYGPYKRKDGRMHVILYSKGERRTMSYPRYLLEQKLNRRLKDHETVDHIDGDCTNNTLDNLQILSLSDNIKKSIKPAKLGNFVCPICNNSFQRKISAVNHNQKSQGKSGPYCSKSCAGRS